VRISRLSLSRLARFDETGQADRPIESRHAGSGGPRPLAQEYYGARRRWIAALG